MTRPASFNNTWAENVDPSQYADESTDTTQGFMKTGWEGGSDKKAPSAKTQNYHMRKHDLAMQETERQGMLSWRSDVPYPSGARTWWHGNVFIALNDNQGVEPQGGNDNGTWFLSPVKNYPATWNDISNKPDTATRWAFWNEIQDKPQLGAAALKDFFDTGDVSKIPYGFIFASSTGCVAAVRDHAEQLAKSVSDSLKKIATTGDLNDGTGVLDMKRGGTGRSDGNISASNVYTAHLESNGDLVLKNGSGDRLSLEHGEVLSIHNADDVEKFRLQDGHIILGGGYVSTIYRYSGATVMQADSGDKLSVERGAVISAHRADDKEHFRVEDGAITLSGGYQPNIFLTDYGLVIKHVSGDSFSIEKEDSMVKKNANGDITFKVIGDQITVGKIPLGQVIGAGDAASRSVVDETDPSKIGWGADRVVSAGTASGLYLYAEAIKNSLGNSAFWDVFASTNPDELDGKDGSLASASALKGLRDRLRTGYLVGTYAVARRTSGDKVKYGQTTDGSNLVTSSSTGDDGNPTRLGGTWYCLGESPDNRGVTLYVRIL